MQKTAAPFAPTRALPKPPLPAVILTVCPPQHKGTNYRINTYLIIDPRPCIVAIVAFVKTKVSNSSNRSIRPVRLSVQWIILAGAINGFIAVLTGAFGAHALQHRISAHYLTIFETANRYHFYHTLALLFLACLAHGTNLKIKTTALFLCIGIVLFCGSLYALALTGCSQLGMITPIGGVAFLAAWACLIRAVYKL